MGIKQKSVISFDTYISLKKPINKQEYLLEQASFYPGIQLAIGLSNGQIYKHKYALIKKIAKTGRIETKDKLIQLFSSHESEDDCLEELKLATEIYNLVDCEMIEDKDNIIRSIICNAEELAKGMEDHIARSLEYLDEDPQDVLYYDDGADLS
jgi:hypothetical protein